MRVIEQYVRMLSLWHQWASLWELRYGRRATSLLFGPSIKFSNATIQCLFVLLFVVQVKMVEDLKGFALWLRKKKFVLLIVVVCFFTIISSEWANVRVWILSSVSSVASCEASQPGVWDQDSSVDVYQVISGELHCPSCPFELTTWNASPPIFFSRINDSPVVAVNPHLW